MVPITGILLDGDTACRAVDAGAAISLDGRRAAFDCGELAGARSVLLGELVPTDAGWTIEKALVQQAPTGEWTILTSETAAAIAVYVGEPAD